MASIPSYVLFTRALATCAAAHDKPADHLKKPIRVIVSIAPGGGTVLAMGRVSRSPPDGYILFGASDVLERLYA